MTSRYVEVSTQAGLDKLKPDQIAVVREGYVVARGSAHVEAWGSAHVVARESAHVVAWESAHVVAWESAHVVARGSAHVVARGSAHVVARESAHVVAWGSAHVVAWESAHVEAWGSAHVVAWESAHVVARESAHVVASDFVAVHNRSPQAVIAGGVVITPPTFGGRKKADPAEWCAYHGVRVDNGIAILYKAVDDDFKSGYGMSYVPGSTPEAKDWKTTKACGNGLHLVPQPSGGLFYFPEATRFVACPVAVDKLVVIDESKVKAKRIEAPGCAEVDRHGKPIVEQVSA